MTSVAAYLWRSEWRRMYPSLCRSPRSNSSDGRRSFRRAGYVSASRSIRLASPATSKNREKQNETNTRISFIPFLLLSSLLLYLPNDCTRRSNDNTKGPERDPNDRRHTKKKFRWGEYKGGGGCYSSCIEKRDTCVSCLSLSDAVVSWSFRSAYHYNTSKKKRRKKSLEIFSIR